MHDQLRAERAKINQIDAQLVQLLNERAQVAVDLGRLKAKLGAPVYDPAREGEVLEHIVSLNLGPLDKGAIEDIFSAIIGACRQIQIPKQNKT